MDKDDVETGTGGPPLPSRSFPLIRSLRGSFIGRASNANSEAGIASSGEAESSQRTVGAASVQGNGTSKALSRMASIAVKSHTGQLMGGLLSGKELAPGEAGDIVSAVKNLRKASMVLNFSNDHNRSPGLASKVGSVCSYFYAPNATPGRGAAFSPAGKHILRYGYGPDIKVLNATDASVAVTLSHPTGHIRFATFSGDGALLAAAADDCRLLIWSVEECIEATYPRPKAVIDVGEEPLAYCQVSPDGSHVLSCDDDGQLELWSIAQECMVHRFEINHPAKVCSFNANGSTVICCSAFDVQVTLLDAATGGVLGSETFDSLEECRNKAAYVISGDGSHVLVYITEHCFVSNVAIFNTRTQSFHKLLACNGAVVHAEFSQDGSDFVVAGRDDCIHVYDSATGSAIVTLRGHTSDVLFCRVSWDRTMAISGDNSGHVLLWDVDTGQCNVRLQGHSQPVVMCDISRDNRRALSVDNEGHAYLWHLDMQSLYDVLRQNSDTLCSVQYTPSGSGLVVGYSDGTVKMWTNGLAISLAWTHTHHEGSPVERIAIKRDGSLIASGARDGCVVIVRADTGALVARLTDAHTDSVTGLLFSANGSVLASSSRDGTLRVWATEAANSGVPLHVIRVPDNSEVLTCALSSNSKVAALGCANGMAYVYSLSSSRQQHVLQVAEVAVQSVEFCDNGRYLALGCANGLTSIVDVESGQCVRQLVGNAEGVHANLFPQSSHKATLSDMTVVTVCSRQAITWDMQTTSKASIADFVADAQGLFHNRTMPNRYFVGHHCLSLFDPHLNAAMYDMRYYDKHPGDSYLFRNGTVLVHAGLNQLPTVLYAPPNTTVHMLLNEGGGARSLDFSSDGHLLVSGNLRGELIVWDVAHRRQMHKWPAHKRSAITCVKFSHDGASVYSCGEDCKVILWNWRTQTQISTLNGHQAPVASVDMALDGSVMASGDKDGIVIVWDPESLQPKQIVAAHEGAVLCCSLSPDGTKVASSGTDEHIVILDSVTGQELMVLDSALDGKGLTIKFSFDGTRVQIGGEKGGVLIWDVQRNCLLYDITAHNGKVFDCSWSGDSRRLLSVGSDGRARLWDSAAGSEICAANLERGFGAVEAGGFVKCDLSVDGSTMAGCTARGQLVLWTVASELRKGPEGSMLYQWLASMPLSRAKEIYQQLLGSFPLLMNMQDSRGWTVLMHAAHDSNPEILKLIVSNVRARSGMLGLTASMAVRALSATEVKAALVTGSGLSVHHNRALLSGLLNTKKTGASKSLEAPTVSGDGDRPSFPRKTSKNSGKMNTRASGNVRFAAKPEYSTDVSEYHPERSSNSALSQRRSLLVPPDKRQSWIQRIFTPGKVTPDGGGDGSPVHSGDFTHTHTHTDEDSIEEPNAISIALAANSADCVGHLIDAVLTEKITPGSYHAITHAIPEVAERYPTLCEAFMNGLPLLVLGDVEVPSSMASQDAIVRAANSYTSYKEMWADELHLDQTEQGSPMVVMEAAMVRLPFAVSRGHDSLLRTIVEADVAVEIFGSETLKAIIAYKWQEFAKRQIYTKSLVYLTYVLTFTAFAIVFSDDIPTNSFTDLLAYQKGQTTIALCIVLFLFGTYYMIMEMYQLYTIGVKAYFDSFWNFIDLLSYGATLILTPCVLARFNVGQGQFVPALISVEVILLWIKQMFFALAIDGLGTFIYMTIEIIKGMRYFMLLLLMLFVSFGTSFMVLFRGPGILSILTARTSPPPEAPAMPPALPPPGGGLLGGVSGGSGNGGGGDGLGATVSDGATLLFQHYSDIGSAILSAFLTIFGNGTEDPRNGLGTDWPQLATILLCLYQFILIVVLLNMLITLMSEVYSKVVRKEKHVFLQGRAELIIEVETTMNQESRDLATPPYLHLLRPVSKGSRSDQGQQGAAASSKKESPKESDPAQADTPADAAADGAGGGPGGGGGGPPGGVRGESALQKQLSVQLGGGGRRETHSLGALMGNNNATMRRKTMHRNFSAATSAAEDFCPSGPSGIDTDTMLREMLGLKRMMEGLVRQVRTIEANQQLLMSVSRVTAGNGLPTDHAVAPRQTYIEFSTDGAADHAAAGGARLPPHAAHHLLSEPASARPSGSGVRVSESNGIGPLPGIQSGGPKRGSALKPIPGASLVGQRSAGPNQHPTVSESGSATQQPLKGALSTSKGVLKPPRASAGHETGSKQQQHVSHITFTHSTDSGQEDAGLAVQAAHQHDGVISDAPAGAAVGAAAASQMPASLPGQLEPLPTIQGIKSLKPAKSEAGLHDTAPANALP